MKLRIWEKGIYRKSCTDPDGFYVHYELKISEEEPGFDLIITKWGNQIKHHFNSTADYNNLVSALADLGFAINCELVGAPLVDYINDEK